MNLYILSILYSINNSQIIYWYFIWNHIYKNAYMLPYMNLHKLLYNFHYKTLVYKRHQLYNNQNMQIYKYLRILHIQKMKNLHYNQVLLMDHKKLLMEK